MRTMKDYSGSDHDYCLQPTLDNLKRRLEKGTVLRGRVVDVFSSNRILLRVQGYNVLTEVLGNFKRFEELELVVTQIFPKIEFRVRKQKEHVLKACHIVDLRL